MNRVSTRFSGEMDQIIAYLELLSAAFALAKNDLKNVRSRISVVRDAKLVHKKARALSTLVVAYDGAYLTTCAQFELAVRDLIEEFVSDLSVRFPVYDQLPKQIKDWHPTGCANILINLNRDRFRHLTQVSVLNSLSSCHTSTVNSPYQLTVEAFSFNDRNFKPETLDEIFSHRLGVSKIWFKIAHEIIIQNYFGTNNLQLAENLARERLKQAMERRNDIIHRGRQYYTPSESEIRACVIFFKTLLSTLSTILDQYLQAI